MQPGIKKKQQSCMGANGIERQGVKRWKRGCAQQPTKQQSPERKPTSLFTSHLTGVIIKP
jgi:hypothetical protein